MICKNIDKKVNIFEKKVDLISDPEMTTKKWIQGRRSVGNSDLEIGDFLFCFHIGGTQLLALVDLPATTADIWELFLPSVFYIWALFFRNFSKDQQMMRNDGIVFLIMTS